MNRFCPVCAKAIRNVARAGGRVAAWRCVHRPRVLVDRRLADGRYEVVWEAEGSNRSEAIGVLVVP